MQIKKLLVAALLAFATFTVNAQWFDFSNNNNRFDVGVQFGVAGIGCPFHDFGVGASFDAYGVYIDFLDAGPKYKYDNHVEGMSSGAAMVPDSNAWTLNVGYQIPVLPWLRIMPLIGFCRNTDGYTDFSTVNIEVNNSDNYSSATMYHDYIKQHGSGRFNFGGGLFVTPIRWLNIYGVYTTHSIYGGIGLNLSALYER
ncbi:MAG: hypothetical protein K5650_02360 [Bacteroidales bacterium]|nr:hypothetical protein [Bacteroidales bacterium]